MRAPFVHDVPASRVVFGCGSLGQVGAEVERLGATRVLLVASGRQAAALEDQLGDRIVGRFSEVVMHVPAEVARGAVAQAQAVGADVVVALGGGSAVGTAKAIAKETGLPILAVPTTYAGSEMTPIWGITDDGRKTTGRDLTVMPRTVVYDPELTLTLSPSLSAASGMNSLAHVVEGLYAPSVSPPLAARAEEAVRALAAALPRVVADPADLDARSEVLYGAWLAGSILGTCTMGVHHKVCHTLGGTYDLPHAASHSAVLPYAAQFNQDHAHEAMAAVVRGFRAAGRDVADAPTALWDLATQIGAPVSLRMLGFPESSITEAAGIVVAGRPTNPRPVDDDGVRALIAAAHAGDRPSGRIG